MGQITPRVEGQTSTGFNDLVTHLPKPKNIIPVLNEEFQAELRSQSRNDILLRRRVEGS